MVYLYLRRRVRGYKREFALIVVFPILYVTDCRYVSRGTCLGCLQPLGTSSTSVNKDWVGNIRWQLAWHPVINTSAVQWAVGCHLWSHLLCYRWIKKLDAWAFKTIRQLKVARVEPRADGDHYRSEKPGWSTSGMEK